MPRMGWQLITWLVADAGNNGWLLVKGLVADRCRACILCCAATHHGSRALYCYPLSLACKDIGMYDK